MSKEYDYDFNMKDKSFHLFNEGKAPFLTNFDISTKNQNIRVVQEMRINNNYSNMDITQIWKKYKNYDIYNFSLVDIPFDIKSIEREEEKRREYEEERKRI